MSENNNPEESDEVISQQLQDMGLLEDGMTPEDRRHLWSVLRLSKDTADAEEEDRQKRARCTVQYNQVSSRSAADDSQKQANEGEQTRTPAVASVPPRQRNRSPCIVEDDEHVTSSCSSKVPAAVTAPNSVFDTSLDEPNSVFDSPSAKEFLKHSNSRTVKTLNTRELREKTNVTQLSTKESDMTLQELAESETEIETEAEILKPYSREGSISPKPVDHCSASSSPVVVKHKEHESLTEESSDNLMQSLGCGDKNNDTTKDVEDDTSALNEKSEDGVPFSSSDVNPVLKDRERNIDAFTCDRSNYERTLKVRKVKRACARLPFYIPPYKMDVHTYIAYFKKCISEQAARLLEVQRRNHHCIPWGDPVIVGECDSMALAVVEPDEQKTTGILNLQRYNFRDRKGAHQKANTIYEDPDDDDDDFVTNTRKATKIEHNSDDIFDTLLEQVKDEDIIDKDIPEDSASENQVNLHVPEAEQRNTKKRKSESDDVYMFQDDEEVGEKGDEPSWLSKDSPPPPPLKLGAKRKKLGPVMYNLRTKDSSVDDQEKESSNKSRKRGPKGNKLRSKNKKRKQKNDNSRAGSEDNDDDDDDDTVLFSTLDEAEGVGGSSRPGSRQEYDVRPGDLRLRGQGRRFVLQTRSSLKNSRHQQEDDSEKKVEAAPMDDITVLYDAGGSSDADVPCPICRKMFVLKDIEAHASECNEYCEEDTSPDEVHHISPCSSPEMIEHNVQNVITEECWSQYDNDHNHQASRRQQQQQHRQQRQQQGTAETKHTPA